MTPTTKQEARRRWVLGEAETSIAEELGLEVSTIEAWRDEEDWPSLRDLIDARAAAARQVEAEDADSRDLFLVSALEGLLTKAMQRGAAISTGQDVYRFATALKIAREVREDVRLTRLDRELRAKQDLMLPQRSPQSPAPLSFRLPPRNAG